RSNSLPDSRHQNDDDLSAGGPPSLAPVSSSRVGGPPVGNSLDHLVGAGEQRWRDDEAKRVLAPGYKDKRQALNLPAVLCAPRDKGHCKISSAPCFEVKRDNAHGVLGQI